MRRLLPCTFGLLLSAFATAPAQEPQTKVVRVQVTSVSGKDIYLDQGRTQGLAPGVIVRLFPPGAGQLDVEVRAVSSSSARADLPAGASPPPVGTRGEVTIDLAQNQGAPQQPKPTRPDGRPVPEHPPWTRQEDPRSPDQPLLVPTYGQRPDQRPMTLDGRLFLNSLWNRDLGNGRADQYLLSRLGVQSEAHNAFGYGERTRFTGEYDDRRTFVTDEPDDRDSQGRIDQASVALGTEHWAPYGLEAGRFFSEHLPELGLFDGVEGVVRTEGGIRAGAGVGSYPLPFPMRDTFEDVGAHAFVDYLADERRSFAASVGAQKTWHQGTPDRDLLLLRLEGNPGAGVSAYANAKIDVYTSSDTLKSPGPQLTETYAQVRWDGAVAGIGLGASQFRWPDLLRQEYQDLSPDLVRDGYVNRLSLNSWGRISQAVRLSGRADLWRDQEDHGTAFEAALDYTGILSERSVLSAALFQSDGGYLSGPGARLTLRQPLGSASALVGYRVYHYTIDSLIDSETYLRQSAEIGLSLPVGRFDVDFTAERWFGDLEDAYALGLYAQWRF